MVRISENGVLSTKAHSVGCCTYWLALLIAVSYTHLRLSSVGSVVWLEERAIHQVVYDGFVGARQHLVVVILIVDGF